MYEARTFEDCSEDPLTKAMELLGEKVVVNDQSKL